MIQPAAQPTLPPGAEEYEAERTREEARRQGLPAVRPLNGVPFSRESEEYLLSCCFIDGISVVDRCVEKRISARSFFLPAHQVVFEVLLEAKRKNLPLENGEALATVAEELKATKQLDQVGGYQFLTEISSRVPTTAQASYFIEKVRNFETLRNLISSATSIVEDCHNFTGDMPDFLSLQEARIAPILRQRHADNKTFTVWTPQQFREWTPSRELNLLGAGYLRRKQITTLIGPPGVGKSRLSLWLAVSHIAGRPWCNLDPLGANLRWLMIGNENDPERQKGDLSWFYRSLTAAEQKKVDDHLFLHVLETHDDSHLTLADPDAYARIVATLKTSKPDVLIFDPWGNMIEANENDNEEVRRTLRLLLRAVAEGAPDAAILIIHHARTGKTNTIEAGNNYSGGSLGRGSKVLVSQARCELALWPGDSEDASRLVLTCEKVNNAPKFEPVGLIFENGVYQTDATFSVKAWRDDIEGKRSNRSISVNDLVVIVRAGHAKTKDLVACAREEFGVAESTVYTRLQEAVKKGWLDKTSAGGAYQLGPQCPDKKISMSQMKMNGVEMAAPEDSPPLVNPNDPEDRAE